MFRRFLVRPLRRLRRLVFPALRRADRLDPHELEAGIDLIYRFLLARSPDEEGRRHYLGLAGTPRMTLREVAAEIAASDEFQERLRRSLTRADANRPAATPPADAPIDAAELARTLSVEELARTADDYYRSTLAFGDRYLAKPFDDPHAVAEVLGSFAQLLGGLRLAPGMVVLDFGAGSGWTTRLLAQLGCEVISLDVSPTALQLGRELMSRLPPIGQHPQPRFLVFDGHRIDLPDASVDRVFCFDAFHHVPNPAEVMPELARVLRPGGLAGFSEPGPNHSKSARSQYEMKNFVAFENDVVMADIWRWARAAGFSDLELAVFTTEPHHVPLAAFEDVLAGGAALDEYGRKVRAFLSGHQTFFLKKGADIRDSRERGGLRAEIDVKLDRAEFGAGEPIRGRATVQNVGTATWLPGAAPLGGVSLGVHLRQRDGQPLAVDFRRVPLDAATPPGRTQTIDFALEPPAPGAYLLEFDLVSERVGWFEMNGSPTATVAIVVNP